jgi:regulator of protease activity HflC (stomatin/prohibitin superfamily)
VVGLIALLLFIYMIPDIFYSVYPGEAAVVWYRFAGGTDIDVRGEGLQIKWPWDRAYIYSIRMQYATRTFHALCSDGMPIQVETTIRFRLHRVALGELHKHVGPDYLETLVLPELGAHVRERISQYRPAVLYTQQREEIQEQILSELKQELLLVYHEGRDPEEAIFVEDVLIRNIVLPPKVAEAIDDKLAQEQRMLEYEYRLQKERREAERKAIEAEGIRRFQDTVTGGISERYLKWKGIDATLELARSPNAKIVIIGAGEDGLPIILGGIDSLPVIQPSSGLAAPPAATGPSSAAPPPSTAPPTELPPG